MPTAESLEEGIEFLRDALEERLIGVDYFRLGWLMDDLFVDIFEMLNEYSWGGEEHEPEPILFEERPEPERWKIVGDDLRDRGVIDYNGV